MVIKFTVHSSQLLGTFVPSAGSPAYSGASPRLLASQGISAPTGDLVALRRDVDCVVSANGKASAVLQNEPRAGFVGTSIPGVKAWSPPV